VRNNRQSGGCKKSLHHILVHAGGGSEHARADVWYAGQLEQSLYRSVFAKSPVQNGEDDVQLQRRLRGRRGDSRAVSFKWNESCRRRSRCAEAGLGRHRRDQDGLSACENSSAGSRRGIAGAKRLAGGCGLTSAEQLLCGRRRHPAPRARDADGNNIKFLAVNRFEDGCGREQRDFVFAGATTEEDTDAEFLCHALPCYRRSDCGCTAGSGRASDRSTTIASGIELMTWERASTWRTHSRRATRKETDCWYFQDFK